MADTSPYVMIRQSGGVDGTSGESIYRTATKTQCKRTGQAPTNLHLAEAWNTFYFRRLWDAEYLPGKDEVQVENVIGVSDNIHTDLIV